MRKEIIPELHKGHLGAGKTKLLARDYLWWPGLNAEIDQEVRNCDTCNKYADNPHNVQNPWETAVKVFERVHIDFAQFESSNFLVCVDALSKFPIIRRMRDITTESTIKELLKIISLFGIPNMIVSDNGTNFTSSLFKKFCNDHGIDHIFTAPHHQQSNGQCERMIRSMKICMNRNMESNNKIDLDIALEKFLFNYRNAPNATTNKIPSEVMFNRTIRTRWDLIKPQEDKVNEFNRNFSSNRNIMNGVKVWYKTFKDNIWDKGTVKRKNGNLIFEVDTGDKIIRRHLDQIKKRYTSSTPLDETTHLKTNTENAIPFTVSFRRNDDQNLGVQEQSLVSQRPSRNIILPKKFDNFIMK
ncbi:unnamed protein product [Gordionus sp. m RMFG-2023]